MLLKSWIQVAQKFANKAFTLLEKGHEVIFHKVTENTIAIA